MNYEQKYKNALERARDLMTKQNPPAFDKHLIEMVFPELAESEDERIGNFLIDFIKVCAWTDKKDQGWPSREDCIAWLEKNKRKFEESEMSITESQPEPKFQVGDKVTMKGDNTVYTIGIIAPDKTCWLKHESREYGWATFSVLKHYVE